MSGKKFDQGKPDLSLVPLSALEVCARAFMLGEKKYGRYNYCGGMEASRLVAAAQRHINKWFQGQDTDPEEFLAKDGVIYTGTHHLGHALACLAMIIETERLGTLKDNRYTTSGKEVTDVCEKHGVPAIAEPTGVNSYMLLAARTRAESGK